MNYQKLMVCVFLLFSGSLALAQESWQCQDLPQAPVATRICIQTPKNHSGEVLYYLHGRGGLPDDWVDADSYPVQIQQYWRTHKIKQPVVIAVGMSPLSSFGFPNVWLLAEKNTHPASGLFDYFIKAIMPLAESKLPMKVRSRTVMGESMGGLNTIQLAFKTKLFKKAAALCPVFSDVSPMSDLSELLNAAKETSAWTYYADKNDPTKAPAVQEAVTLAYQLAQVFFDKDGWNTFDPFVLGQTANHKSLPKLYVTNGKYDKYANYESVEKWVGQLKTRKIKTEWHPMWGGHCAIDIPSLSRFLTK